MDRIDGLLLREPGGRARHAKLRAEFTRTPSARREAQALRWRVFAEEMGARLDARTPGIDEDLFDAHCEHLVVRDEGSDEVVGTYRLLPPSAAKRLGAGYADAEFDLTRLRGIRARMVEVGRSCIHPAYRTGAVIALLWAGLTRYMVEHGHAFLGGCASMGMADGGRAAAAAYERLAAEHLAPVEYHVYPRRRLPVATGEPAGTAAVPPLLRGYLRAGAWICGEPAWDPEFNTADFFVLLRLASATPRYARHFLGTVAN
jgi:putative hemolysin